MHLVIKARLYVNKLGEPDLPVKACAEDGTGALVYVTPEGLNNTMVNAAGIIASACEGPPTTVIGQGDMVAAGAMW